MKTNNLCFVTGLFDIGRGELLSGFGRSFDHYLNSFEKLLKIKYPMVIYVPSELNDWVWQRRSPDNTKIINKTLDDIRNFPFYNKVQEIRIKPEWINQSGWIVDSTQAKLPLYNPLVMSKQFMLNDATLFNFFDTKYYLWVDAGIANTLGDPDYYFNEQFESKVTPDLDKMMYVAFPYESTAPEVHGFIKPKLNELAGTVTEHVCRGGLFGGNKNSINEINDIYYQLLNSTLEQGYMGTEESIFTIISYKHKDKCKVNLIESNGLIFKYLERLRNQEISKPKAEQLALYFLVFNTPKQLEYTINTWKNAYPDEFKEAKKYVVNNSNDNTINDEYQKLFIENNLQEFKFDNIGINDGRQFVAEHFDKSDHEYYVFIEEDMGVYEKADICRCGLTTYHKDLFEKAINIMKDEDLDFLRLTFSEFFGDSMVSWSYINNPQFKKDLFYPPKDGLVAANTYSPNLLNKPKVQYLGIYKGLPYAIGNYHYSNWPILFNKRGNKKIFLDIKYDHLFEQTLMSQASYYWEEGGIKVGCLLASPILHNRIYHYDGSKRRENKHYTN